ncbi:hypothetical protein PZE06_02515 [Robertmurraya sp. DFI.2.37]|jgi:hypothetical protein|uniref:hypothetical protein n=1 Tax=Robertmurraya sp. DFI.2.37 TaxID=3031819 RepID=UPI001245EA0D|nr:hypothetical protein [Robertmurraya sp. DFI.2.37]MDF1507050.1 hypothetical protein [Robertmurraya sp. DFI.2.37]
MKEQNLVPFENTELLKEISVLRSKKNELYHKSGPNSPIYLDLALKLDFLETQYIEEKIGHLIKD